MASAIKKVNKITQIVRLRQVVRSWKAKSLSRRSVLCYSSDGCSAGRTTPSGSLAVYIGPDRARVVIPTRFLNFPVFVALLHQAEEEFGFQTSGGLALPCDLGFFRQVLRLLDEDEERFRGRGLDEFLGIMSEFGVEPYEYQTSCKESSSTTSSHGFTPLLPKTRV